MRHNDGCVDDYIALAWHFDTHQRKCVNRLAAHKFVNEAFEMCRLIYWDKQIWGWFKGDPPIKRMRAL